jgi:hypothetical protein
MTATTPTEDQLEAQFPPVRNHQVNYAAFKGCLFETWGQDVAFAATHDSDNVWAVMDGDDGNMFMAKGIHFVNRIGYLISTVPVGAGKHYGVPSTSAMTTPFAIPSAWPLHLAPATHTSG